MKKRLWNIYHCCALETACLLLSRWIKDPQSFLVCEVATSEAQSCLHGISFCGNRALKIDAIHQCNPPSISSFLCDFVGAPCHFRYKHLICNHHAPAFKLLVALVNLLTFWWPKWRIFTLCHLSNTLWHRNHQWKPVNAPDRTLICLVTWLNLRTRAEFKSKVSSTRNLW